MSRKREKRRELNDGEYERTTEPSKNITSLNLGRVPEFDVDEGEWNVYLEVLDQFFLVNAIEEERKVSVLITSMGTKAYKYLKDLCVPDLPKDKSFADICNIMKQQFSQTLSVFRERITFYDCCQKSGELVRDWYARVKKSSSLCSFGNRLEDVLKDKFVCGMLEGPIRERLCEEDPQVRSLSNLFDLALIKEQSFRKKSLPSISEVDSIQHRSNQNKNRSNAIINTKTNQPRCTICGWLNHGVGSCRYKDFKCRKCGKIGHLQRVCPLRLVKAVSESKEEDEERCFSEGEECQKLQSVEIYNISKKSHAHVPPVLVDVKIDEKMIKMEIDTGSSISLIPYSIYEKYFSRSKPLDPPTVRLRSFSGEIIEPKGSLIVDVKWQNKSHKCTLLIVENAVQALLGRDWLKTFSWPGLRQVEEVVVVDNELQSLISRHKELFREEVGRYKYAKIDLTLKPNVTPRFVKPRPIPFAFREQVDKELDRLEQTGMIEKVDYSKWGTPLVPILKENGQIRICANYKITVNPHLEDVIHPLPRIEEIWAALEGGKEYTKLDFRNAYNHIELEEESKMLLAWSTHRGVYKVNRLTFGPKPAVAIFQREIEKTLQGLDGVVVFLDDIIITGKTHSEHLQNLESVLKRIYDAGFRCNLGKCEFFKKEVKYLGHIINEEGIRKDPSKISSVLDCPRPKNVSELRAFVGFVNYFGRFIKSLATILSPLYQLLKKGQKFVWDTRCEDSFKKAKEQIASDGVLVHFDRRLPLLLYCDASKYGIGAVLLHEMPDGSKRPISYASRTLNDAECNYSTIHKEALGLFWGIKKFHQYLMGRRFVLLSDHKPLAAVFGDKKGIPEMAAGRLQRWALFMSGFDYEFKHCSSLKNLADAVSRLPISNQELDDEDKIDYVNLVSDVLPVKLMDIKTETRKDPVLSKVVTSLNHGWSDSTEESLKPYYNRRNELSVESGVVMWGYRMVIPSKFKDRLLKELHTAHFGMTKMKSRARSYFWWPSLDADIEKFCKLCNACMSNQQQPKLSTSQWSPTQYPFERVHLDFAGPFKGKQFMVLTDAFSKWPEVFEVSSTSTEVSTRKLRETFARFGLPKVLVTDNATQFTSKEFKDFCTSNVIEHITSPPFHPSSNGAAENAVKSFKKGLIKHLADSQKENISIQTAISRYLFAYRISIHCTTGETPAKLMFGRELRNRMDALIEGDSKTRAITEQRTVEFQRGEEVYVRDYRYPSKGTRWTRGVVTGRLGEKVYIVKPEGSELSWKRHIDQILKILSQTSDES